MTDVMDTPMRAADLHTSDEARRRMSKRYATERRFQLVGLSAVLVAMGFLVLLLSTIINQAIPAFTYHYVTLPFDLSAENVDPDGTRDPAVIGRADFDTVARNGIRGTLDFVSGRSDRRLLSTLLSSGAGIDIRRQVLADMSLIGGTRDLTVQLDDYADLYLKGLVTDKVRQVMNAEAMLAGDESTVSITTPTPVFTDILGELKTELRSSASRLRGQAAARQRSVTAAETDLAAVDRRLPDAPDADRSRLEGEKVRLEELIAAQNAQIDQLTAQAVALEARADAADRAEPADDNLPSVLVSINGGVLRATNISPNAVEAEILVPLDNLDPATAGEWSVERLTVPQANRKLNDKAIAWIDYLDERDLVEQHMNVPFFTKGASREPEQAGIWGAVVGSFWTMVVTLILSFPLGVAAAIYLEEFAPKNRLTQIIEVNINNLAAVPSIVFGLLGLAVFLSVFGLPRSAPLVGGMVLALMTLPTIIIAARAALRAVPPSIREAALGMGASKLQCVMHHVLPLAMPGILTGTIIGMAQALGETAPLLMIGMVAFIVDIPSGPLSAATVLPVQIYMWADFPEPAFQQKTGAAIMVLLGFLILMNAIAVLLRKRFERRW